MKGISRWWFALAGAAVFAVAAPARAVLTDMIGHWAAPLVSALQVRGIIAGDVDGLFHPEKPLTRAQMAKLLTVSLGREADAELLQRYPSRFADVPDFHWAKGYVEALAETGITTGYSANSFAPEDPVTRAQMAVFLIRAAGLADQAYQMRFEKTGYRDDAAIPDWARGAVNVARLVGLMEGFEDQTFRPNDPLTRAEGSTALRRLLALEGQAYNLAGTLIAFNPRTGEGIVRDELGQERSFVMASDAVYYRGGVLVTAREIEPLDQVWIILNDAGEGCFLEARFADLYGTHAVVEGDTLQVMVAGQPQRFALQPGALVFYNGRPASLQEVHGAEEVFLALDRQTGEVRVLDAVSTPLRGSLTAVDAQAREITVRLAEGEKRYSLSPEAVVQLDGMTVGLGSLKAGYKVRLALDETLQVTYILAER